MSQFGTVVVKIGSSLLVDQDGSVRRDWLAGLVEDIVMRRASGQQVILVSSGAIALGARKLALPKGGRASLEDAQAAAATGQIALSQGGLMPYREDVAAGDVKYGTFKSVTDAVGADNVLFISPNKDALVGLDESLARWKKALGR